MERADTLQKVKLANLRHVNQLLEQICYSLRVIGTIVLQEYAKEMIRLGIDPLVSQLCEREEVEPGIDGERDALHENMLILRRLLHTFLPQALGAYSKLNEYFERKAIGIKKVEELQENIVASRLKIIELLQFLKTDDIISHNLIESPRERERKRLLKEAEELLHP